MPRAAVSAAYLDLELGELHVELDEAELPAGGFDERCRPWHAGMTRRSGRRVRGAAHTPHRPGRSQGGCIGSCVNRGRCPSTSSPCQAETRGNDSDSIWIPYGMILVLGKNREVYLG